MFISFALKIKRKIFESFRIWTGITHLTENIFGLNCEDWDNVALS